MPERLALGQAPGLLADDRVFQAVTSQGQPEATLAVFLPGLSIHEALQRRLGDVV